MSKQSEAIKKQGYVPKAVPQTCVNCAEFKFEETRKDWFPVGVYEQGNLRCGIGGFAVKKMGTCDFFVGKS